MESREAAGVAIVAVHEDELAAVAGRLGEGEAALGRAAGVAALLDARAPAWLLVVGVASGVPADEPSLGDVVVAASVLDHDAPAVLADGTRAFPPAGAASPEAAAVLAELAQTGLGHRPGLRPDEPGVAPDPGWSAPSAIGRAAPVVDLSLRGLYGTKKAKAEVHALLRRRAEAGPRPPALVTGVVLGSDGPLDEAALARAAAFAPRRLRAVEAGSLGVYRIAHERRVPVLSIHGVADVIGAARRPAWAEYARHAAASFAVALLRSGALRHRGSTPRSPPASTRRPGDALAEAAQLARLGDAALARGEVDGAAELYEKALPLSRSVGDVRGEASSALRLGEIALRRGEADEARRRYQEALPLFRRVQDALGEANCVARLGDLALRRGDVEEARARCLAALPLYRRAGDVLGEANGALRLGDLALRGADPADARERFEEALALYARIPEPYSMGLCHRRLSRLAADPAARTRHVQAARELWMRAGRLDMVAKLDEERR